MGFGTKLTDRMPKFDQATLREVTSGISPADEVLQPHQLAGVPAALGFPAKLVVTRADNETIPKPLRDLTGPGPGIAMSPPRILGVHCGSAFGLAIVVGFRDAQAADQFLRANPSLKACPVSRWAGFTLLWFASDLRPGNKEVADVICVAEGIVPLAWADQEPLKLAIRGGALPAMRYADIVWPAHVRGAFRYDWLKALFGGFFVQSKRKRRLNLKLWAAWIADKNGLVYDSRLNAFRCASPDGKEVQVLGTGGVYQLVVTELIDASARAQDSFPVAEIRPARIREIMHLMQAMAAMPVASEAEGLEEFLRTQLKAAPGAKVTCEDLWLGYRDWCVHHTAAAYPACEFRRLAPKRIRDIFGINRSHSIGSKRGYRNLVLVSVQQAASPAAGTMSTRNKEAGTEGTLGTSKSTSAGCMMPEAGSIS